MLLLITEHVFVSSLSKGGVSRIVTSMRHVFVMDDFVRSKTCA